MGLFSTHWQREYEGHKIEVVRKMGGHEFELHLDGQTVDIQTSVVNMGKRHLEGTIEHGDAKLKVHAIGIQGAFGEAATVTVGDTNVPMKKIA